MYQVEAIVGKRVNTQTNSLEYQVKWCNYSNEQNTWQPQRNLKFVKNLIEDFNKKTQMKGDLGLLTGNRPKNAKQEVKTEKRIPSERILDNDQARAEIFFQDQSSREEGANLDNEFNQLQKKDKQPNENKDSMPSMERIGSQKLVSTQQQKQPSRQQEEGLQKMGAAGSMLGNKNNLSEDRSYAKGEKIQLSKKTPPLPPDFAINKSRYIDPELLKNKQTANIPPLPKRKFIEKDRNKEMPPSKKQYEFRPVLNQRKSSCPQLIPDPLNMRLATKPMIPPMPSPYFPQQSTPILQQNYFSNQYQVYNNRPSELYNPIMKSVPGVPSSQTGITHEFGQRRPTEVEDWSYRYENNPRWHKNDHRREDKPLRVFGVRSMEKSQSGYVYLAETNQGTLWLSRDQLVPKFSVLLLEFYERHLRFD